MAVGPALLIRDDRESMLVHVASSIQTKTEAGNGVANSRRDDDLKTLLPEPRSMNIHDSLTRGWQLADLISCQSSHNFASLFLAILVVPT